MKRTDTVAVTGLHAEYRSTPQLGIDTRNPRLSWRIESSRRGTRQTACRILAGRSREDVLARIHLLWDSNWILTANSQFHEYAGLPLASRQRVWWQVVVRDEQEKETPSELHWFETGLLNRSDWTAKWIEADLVGGHYQSIPSPFLRRTFIARDDIQSARLYITALGCQICSINGRRVSDEELSSGWIDFRRRARVSVHDVTLLLTPGQNVIGVILGDGWYCGHTEKFRRQAYGDRPRLLAQLEIRYSDGSVETVVSDASWRVAFGPILASDIIMGEEYDARLCFQGWDTSNFDDARWHAALVTSNPSVELKAWEGPPIRRIVEVPPVAEPTASPAKGAWIYNLGQNIVGRVRLKVSAPAGTTFTLRYGERLDSDGSLYTDNLRTARATDHYTCRGGGTEEWESSFTFHGFQYVEVRSLRDQPPRDMITGVVLHSDCPSTAEFTCSHPLVNRLFQNIVWGWKGNSLDVPTDCPQRDERLGWTGDAQAFVTTAASIAEINGFFAKWLQDLRDAQNTEGAIPSLSPCSHIGGNWGDGGPGWADAMVICPWHIYVRYGDKRLLRQHWPALLKWMEQQQRTARDGLRAYPQSGTSCFGDWLALDGSEGCKGATPHALIGCAFFAHAADLTSRIALALGETSSAERFSRLFSDVRSSFQRHFLTPDGKISPFTQTAAVLALHFDLVPAPLRASIANALENDIRQRGTRLATGFLGTPYLQFVLTAESRIDTASALLFQTQWPSWLYAVTQGATTVWERWDGWTAENGFQNPAMNSFNHYAFGAVGDWLLSRVLGISPHSDSPGMQKFLLHPLFLPGLEHAAGHIDSPYGRIVSAWRRSEAGISWDTTVPANTTAQVLFACTEHAVLTESGRVLTESDGVHEPERNANGVSFVLDPGSYSFRVEYRV